MSGCYLDTSDKTACTGCRVCEMSCPKNAITMVEDDEGFIYPRIDEKLCIHCDICRKKCPVSNPPRKRMYIDVYAAQAKDKKDLANSSSGGCFITVARQIISRGGVVFGCILDKDFNAKTVAAYSYEDLIPMQGSKYVQCDTCNTYRLAEAFLKLGRKVLFTGTPCQIAGLNNYLGEEYDNLITMDFLCHGVPSNRLFKKNIEYLENKYKSKLSNYKFRDKSKRGWGVMTSFSAGRRKVYQDKEINSYSNAFLSGYIDRISCYSCKFVGQKRISDITVADFWGIKNSDKKFRNPWDGISLFVVNSEKGRKALDEISEQMTFSKRKIEEAIPQNGSLGAEARNIPIPPMRNTVYENIDNYSELAQGALRPKYYTILLMKQIIPKWCVNFIRKFKS